MRTISILMVTATLLVAGDSEAAGLYFSDRGVRPMARGGAFVAGADDLGAIYYNPAGLVDAGTQLLLDASWLRFVGTFQRQVRVQGSDPNTGEPVGNSSLQTYDKVQGTSPILPIPTLAGSYAILPNLVVAAGLYAPYSAIASYPEKVNGKPAPQRYSLLTMDGSALSILGAWVAYKPIKQLQIGVGPTVLLGTIQSDMYLNACVPDRFLCAPEQPEYDTKARVSMQNVTAMSGTFGAVISPIEMLRVGTSFQLPYTIDETAKLQTRLPSTAVFDGAYFQGDSLRIHLKLPWIARAGIEFRPVPSSRIEAAFVYEKWSMQDRIDVTPEDLSLRNVALFPSEYRASAVSVPRHFQDAWSIRVGGEQSIRWSRYKIDLRAGLSYEKSAVPPSYLSVMSVDMDKFLVAIGGGLHINEHWRFDGTAAMLFPSKVTVPPEEAKLYKINPVRANKPEEDLPINAGHYEVSALLLGVGLRYQFGGVDQVK